jgi:hypothetical protein
MKTKTLRWALAVLTCAGLGSMALADEDKEKPEGRKERPERKAGEDRPSGDRPGGDRPDRQGGGRPDMFAAMDDDGDGKVTKDEFVAFHMKRFKEMDADSSGDVSKEEAEKAMSRFRPGGARPGGDRPESGVRKGGDEKKPERPKRPASE